MGKVYLCHLEKPLSPDSTAQHYIGYTAKNDVKVRLAEHKAGQGARFTQVAVERGIAFEVVRVWTGDRKLERKLKNRHNSKMLCPICNKKST